MIASTCMVAAQLWQWRRLEEGHREGEVGVFHSLFTLTSLFANPVNSVFFGLLGLIVWMRSWRWHWRWPQSFHGYEQVKYFILHISREGKDEPQLCVMMDDSHSHAFAFFLHQLNGNVSDFSWQYSLRRPNDECDNNQWGLQTCFD